MPPESAARITRRQDIPTLLLAWYDAHHRDLPWRVAPRDLARGTCPDPYRVWLSEVMLQQTTVEAVKAYFRKFVEKWPTVEALAEGCLAEWPAARDALRDGSLFHFLNEVGRADLVPKPPPLPGSDFDVGLQEFLARLPTGSRPTPSGTASAWR